MKIPKVIHLHNNTKYKLVRPEKKAKIQNSVCYWHSRSGSWQGAAACGVHVDEENEWLVSEPNEYSTAFQVTCERCLEIYEAYQAATAPNSAQTLMWTLEEAVLGALFSQAPKTYNQLLEHESVVAALSVVRPNIQERVLNKALKHLRSVKLVGLKSNRYSIIFKHEIPEEDKWRYSNRNRDEVEGEAMMSYWKKQK